MAQIDQRTKDIVAHAAPRVKEVMKNEQFQREFFDINEYKWPSIRGTPTASSAGKLRILLNQDELKKLMFRGLFQDTSKLAYLMECTIKLLAEENKDLAARIACKWKKIATQEGGVKVQLRKKVKRRKLASTGLTPRRSRLQLHRPKRHDLAKQNSHLAGCSSSSSSQAGRSSATKLNGDSSTSLTMGRNVGGGCGVRTPPKSLIPDDCSGVMLEFLTPQDVARFQSVNTIFASVAKKNSKRIWKRIFSSRFPDRMQQANYLAQTLVVTDDYWKLLYKSAMQVIWDAIEPLGDCVPNVRCGHFSCRTGGKKDITHLKCVHCGLYFCLSRCYVQTCSSCSLVACSEMHSQEFGSFRFIPPYVGDFSLCGDCITAKSGSVGTNEAREPERSDGDLHESLFML